MEIIDGLLSYDDWVNVTFGDTDVTDHGPTIISPTIVKSKRKILKSCLSID